VRGWLGDEGACIKELGYFEMELLDVEFDYTVIIVIL
jgi:hypothetical protein